MFLVVKGRFRMEFLDRHEWIEEGEFIVVPRGVEHRPVADEECWILLFEPASTLNTGNVVNERTLNATGARLTGHRSAYESTYGSDRLFRRWCPDCREAKRFLAKHNIPYKEIDVQTTPGAIDEIVKRTGKRAIPQFVIDGEWVQPYDPRKGFLYDEMAKRLGIKTP